MLDEFILYAPLELKRDHFADPQFLFLLWAFKPDPRSGCMRVNIPRLPAPPASTPVPSGALIVAIGLARLYGIRVQDVAWRWQEMIPHLLRALCDGFFSRHFPIQRQQTLPDGVSVVIERAGNLLKCKYKDWSRRIAFRQDDVQEVALC